MHTKKRDCTVAVPLLEALACLYTRTNNIEPTPTCTHTYTPIIVCMDIDIHIPRTSKCCNVLGIEEIC